MDNKLTIIDALRIMYRELAQISVPAEQTFTIGIHVGKTLALLKDCISSFEQDQQTKEKEEKTVPMFPQEAAETVESNKEIDAGQEEDSE